MDDYTHKSGIVYKNQFHIIWTPKYRRPVLVDGVDARLKDLLYEIAAEQDIAIKALEIMPDHVHIFIEFDPRKVLHKIIKDMKGRTSKVLRQEFPWLRSRIPSLWTRSYFSCSVGHVSEDTVRRYIEDQKKR